MNDMFEGTPAILLFPFSKRNETERNRSQTFAVAYCVVCWHIYFHSNGFNACLKYQKTHAVKIEKCKHSENKPFILKPLLTENRCVYKYNIAKIYIYRQHQNHCCHYLQVHTHAHNVSHSWLFHKCKYRVNRDR